MSQILTVFQTGVEHRDSGVEMSSYLTHWKPTKEKNKNDPGANENECIQKEKCALSPLKVQRGSVHMRLRKSKGEQHGLGWALKALQYFNSSVWSKGVPVEEPAGARARSEDV